MHSAGDDGAADGTKVDAVGVGGEHRMRAAYLDQMDHCARLVVVCED